MQQMLLFTWQKVLYNGLSSRIRDRLDIKNIHFINHDSCFEIKDIRIEALQIFHDAIDPVGYTFSQNDRKLVYITDTGYVHHALFDKISDAKLLYIWIESWPQF